MGFAFQGSESGAGSVSVGVLEVSSLDCAISHALSFLSLEFGLHPRNVVFFFLCRQFECFSFRICCILELFGLLLLSSECSW